MVLYNGQSGGDGFDDESGPALASGATVPYLAPDAEITARQHLVNDAASAQVIYDL